MFHFIRERERERERDREGERERETIGIIVFVNILMLREKNQYFFRVVSFLMLRERVFLSRFSFYKRERKRNNLFSR